MSQAPRDQKTLHALTGIRALAAAWVVVFHLRRVLLDHFPGMQVLDGLISLGYLGVDLFFTLSGFVLTYNYLTKLGALDTKAYLQFLGLRLARVYPVHLAMTLAFVVGTILAPLIGAHFGQPQEDFRMQDLVRHLTLTHAWGGAGARSWNFPSWSISAEWGAYLVFPFLGRLLHQSPWRLGLLVLGAGIYAVMLYLAHHVYGPTLDLTMDGGMLRVAGGFSVGCLLCGYYLSAPLPSKYWDAGALLCALAIVVSCLAMTRPFWIVYLFGFLILALAKSRGAFSAWLGGPVMVYLGKISYAFYMVHAVILLRVAPDVFKPLGMVARTGLLLGVLLCALVAAHILYSWVEEPFRKRIRKWVLSF